MLTRQNIPIQGETIEIAPGQLGVGAVGYGGAEVAAHQPVLRVDYPEREEGEHVQQVDWAKNATFGGNYAVADRIHC